MSPTDNFSLTALDVERFGPLQPGAKRADGPFVGEEAQMKEKELIYRGNPCAIKLEDPELKTLRDARARGPELCRYYTDRSLCSPPRFGCVRLAGSKVARYVLSDAALELDRDERGACIRASLALEKILQRAHFRKNEVTEFLDAIPFLHRGPRADESCCSNLAGVPRPLGRG